MTNPYAKYVQPSQQPATGPVYGPPPVADPYKQSAEQRAQAEEARKQQDQSLQMQKIALDMQKSQLDIEDARRKAEKEAGGGQLRDDSISQLKRVIEKIDSVAIDSADNAGWFETGTTGSLLRGIPGTAAYDLQANINTIDANAAFDKLAQMRAASPTGGALGNVTEKELELLKASVASLDPRQSQDSFFNNAASAKRVYLDMLRKLDPAEADAYAKKKGIRFRQDGAAILVPTDGDLPEDTQYTDPLGINPGGSPPNGGGAPPSGGGSEITIMGATLPQIGRGLAEGTGSIVQGIGDTLGIVLNPIGQTLYEATGYGDQRYDAGKILREATGLPANPNPVSDAVTRYGTGALTGSLAAKGLAGMAQGATRGALEFMAASPGRDTLAGATAGLGAEVARRNDMGPAGQVAGAVAGGLAGYKAGNSLANIGNSAPNALALAAGRQGVDLLPADAGGTATKILTSGAKASPLSAGPIRSAARKSIDQLSGASERAAGAAAPTTDVAGAAVKKAAQRYTKETAQRGEQMYTRAYQQAQGIKIKPLQTLSAIDEQLARLSQNPADVGSSIQELQALRKNIENGVSIQGLRDARTKLSQGVYNGKMRDGAEQGMWKQVLGKVADDIDAGLRSAGRDGTANLFRRADEFWKGRVEHIDEVLQPLLGNNKGGEQIIQTVETMARGGSGGNAQLSRLLANMKPEEAAGVRATLIERIGKATPGQQDAVGEVFAPSTFLTNWNKMTPQAKASIFSDPAQRKSLDDIALIAENMKATQGMANHSNTAMAVAGGGNAVGGVALAATLHPVATLLVGGTQFLTGKLLASPRFANLLAKASKLPPAAAQRSLMDQLKVLGTREPAIRTDLQPLLQHLGNSAAQSPMRAAAQEESN